MVLLAQESSSLPHASYQEDLCRGTCLDNEDVLFAASALSNHARGSAFEWYERGGTKKKK